MKAKGEVWIFFDRVLQKKTKPLELNDAQILLLNMKSKNLKNFYVWTPGWTEWRKLDEFLKSDKVFFALAPSKIPRGVKKKKIDPDDNKTVVVRTEPADDDKTIFISEAHSVITRINNTVSTRTTQVSSIHDETPTQVEVDYERVDFHGDHLKLKSKGVSKGYSTPQTDRRKMARFDYELDVILISKTGKSFRSTTTNISLAGLRIETPILRDILGASFDIIIVNKFEKDPKKNRILIRSRMVSDLNDLRSFAFIDPSKEIIQKLQSLFQACAKIVEGNEKP